MPDQRGWIYQDYPNPTTVKGNMRWSRALIPTLRDDPADAEAVSHKLLVRAGFIRRLAAGSYSILPLGERVRAHISEIIRQEMNAIGGQELHLPALHPAEVWQRSGRWESMGEELYRLSDRRESELCLGMTHEEIIAGLATEITSYRQLPQIWYQIQTKFRDEPRPKSGVLRVREFTMKDSYSLDIDRAGLDEAFEHHREAYQQIFARCGLNTVDIEASSGAMGGSESVEFMIRSPAGEDWVITCDSCGYRANLERAVAKVPELDDGEQGLEVERFPTPGIRTIAGLAEMEPKLATPERQLKSLVYLVDEEPLMVVLRGDHNLAEQKLIDASGTTAVEPATPEQVRELLGALPGSLGAVGVTSLTVWLDPALKGRYGMVTGANQDDWHIKNVDVSRDIGVNRWVDLRQVSAGEPCLQCGLPLDLWKGIEVGHIFKLGTRYAETFAALVNDEHGESNPIVMGSYGIGVERTMAAIVESSHDEKGIIWPVSVAPYQVVVTAIRPEQPEVEQAASQLSEELVQTGVSVIYDDREERPGVKFADAELVGFPYRVTIGTRGLEQGTAEVTCRKTMETEKLPLDQIVGHLIKEINGQ